MSLDLIIVTPQGETRTELVESVQLPGATGEMGVLEGHVNLLSALDEGVMNVLLGDGHSERLAIESGFVEISQGLVVVIADACLGAERSALAPPRTDDLSVVARLEELLDPTPSDDPK